MEECTLLTYKSLAELSEIKKAKEIFTFLFGKTKEMIDDSLDFCLNISALIYYLQFNKNNILQVYANFEHITEETVITAEETIANQALALLPFHISNVRSYFSEEINSYKKETPSHFKPYARQNIYTYNTTSDLDKIIQYSAKHNIPIATFSQVNGEAKKEFEQLNKFGNMELLDLTSASYVIESNKTIIYALEELLVKLPNAKVISQSSRVDMLLNLFPLFFDGKAPIYELFPDLIGLDEEIPKESKIVKITDLDASSFDIFMNAFDQNLIGHNIFKIKLRHALKNFIFLNKIKEQRVFSIFLFGASGIGKTEVARLIANNLQDGCYLAKINFQNYSSQDALNSLIGSPAGYVGCEHGELSKKIKKSKVGVLLCDEFEKTTRPVISFFLELLEEGKFTDSMAREYNLDGYIIIFTSNLLNEAEYKKVIPLELQTRLDLVCEFEEPSPAEKRVFLDLLLNSAKTKCSKQFEKITMTEEDKKKLYDFDYSSLPSLRDIKRVFNQRLSDYFAKNGL